MATTARATRVVKRTSKPNCSRIPMRISATSRALGRVLLVRTCTPLESVGVTGLAFPARTRGLLCEQEARTSVLGGISEGRMRQRGRRVHHAWCCRVSHTLAAMVGGSAGSARDSIARMLQLLEQAGADSRLCRRCKHAPCKGRSVVSTLRFDLDCCPVGDRQWCLVAGESTLQGPRPGCWNKTVRVTSKVAAGWNRVSDGREQPWRGTASCSSE